MYQIMKQNLINFKKHEYDKLDLTLHCTLLNQTDLALIEVPCVCACVVTCNSVMGTVGNWVLQQISAIKWTLMLK